MTEAHTQREAHVSGCYVCIQRNGDRRQYPIDFMFLYRHYAICPKHYVEWLKAEEEKRGFLEWVSSPMASTNGAIISLHCLTPTLLKSGELNLESA
jgi:hypothetical protein